MKKLLMVLCFLTLVIGIAEPGAAQVITFEDLYPGYAMTEVDLPENYQGFIWSPMAKGMTRNAYTLPNFSALIAYSNGMVGDVGLTTRFAEDIYFSGGVFDFTGAYITSVWDEYQDVVVEGWRDGGVVYSETITSYSGTLNWFDFNFIGIDMVWFRPQGAHLCIDNITVSETSPVPVPAAVWLLGSGLIGLMGLRKKGKLNEPDRLWSLKNSRAGEPGTGLWWILE